MGGIEDALEFMIGGEWNDLPANDALAYIVEFFDGLGLGVLEWFELIMGAGH